MGRSRSDHEDCQPVEDEDDSDNLQDHRIGRTKPKEDYRGEEHPKSDYHGNNRDREESRVTRLRVKRGLNRVAASVRLTLGRAHRGRVIDRAGRR